MRIRVILNRKWFWDTMGEQIGRIGWINAAFFYFLLENRALNPQNPCQSVFPLYPKTNFCRVYQQYMSGLEANFRRSFLNHCWSEARRVETFTDTYGDKTMHCTLYYYDQSGNLVQTVPPSGVEFVTGNVAAARPAGTNLHADHKLVTKYWYNSLNQVVKQETPDAGESHFWYDALGRLVLSQNAKQLTQTRYSYTLLDELGRTTQVGELEATLGYTYDGLDAIVKDKASWNTWLINTAAGRQQVTRTYYDAVPTIAPSIPNFAAQNLRNRVAMTTFSETGSETGYDYATHYTYDVAGNVTTLIHNVPQFNEMTYRYYENSLETRTHRFKRLDYELDLISGKVNELWYPRGAPDQFAYQYEYDADNRLVAAKTSTDGYTWVADAKYKYYKHGPLSRTELGNQIQGVDYAYTLQGWIKGVNGVNGSAELNTRLQNDMGKDGLNGFAPDVFGYTIGYNSTDYAPIGGIHAGFEPTNNITTTQGLYNGNIRYTTNPIKGFSAISYIYGYDQLNRLSGMRSKTITGNDWSLNVATDHNYEETVTYDANGNIRTYWRNQETGDPLDKLTYNYDATKKNRLLSVNDAADPTPTFKDDVEGTETFAYDAIGNLTTHTKPSGATALEWNAYGKVRQVTQQTTTGNATITFGYDAQQNRLSKTVTVNGETKTSYYIRDAQGNALAVYERRGSSLVWKEQDLYGSSRLGMAKPEREMTGFFGQSASYTLVTGARSYELSNHLGNVLAVVSDRGDLQSAQDYFPFGMAMPGRTWSASTEKYKYGFNGKETDPETGLNDFGARLYDSRLGRWLAVDPLAKKYPAFSPYSFVNNMPIIAIDPNGKEIIIVVREEGEEDSEKAPKEKVMYCNGALFLMTREVVYNKYKDVLTPYKGNNEFVLTVKKDLDLLRTTDPLLSNRLEDLETSSLKHFIERNTKTGNITGSNGTEAQEKAGVRLGSTTHYNEKSTDGLDGERPPVIGLAHELLGHSWDTDQGKIKQGTTEHTDTEKRIPLFEVDAVNIENIARKALKLETRTKYSAEDKNGIKIEREIPKELLKRPEK